MYDRTYINNDSEEEDLFFPPPWEVNEHPQKTEGWFEFQKAMRKDPKYYLSEFIDINK